MYEETNPSLNADQVCILCVGCMGLVGGAWQPDSLTAWHAGGLAGCQAYEAARPTRLAGLPGLPGRQAYQAGRPTRLAGWKAGRQVCFHCCY